MYHEKKLDFVAFTSCINPSFWHKLSELKLEVDKLDEISHNVWGYYSNLNQTKSIFEVDSTSFNRCYNESNHYLPYHGSLLNKNTIESFKDCNKIQLMQLMSKNLNRDLKNGTCLTNPSLLNIFFILSFADLKKYNFYYWFAFPTSTKIKTQLYKTYSAKKLFSDEAVDKLYDDYMKLDINNRTFFLVDNTGKMKVRTLESKINTNDKSNFDAYKKYLFAFSDPSAHKEYPGWPLRNYVMLLLYYCPVLHGKTIRVLSYRLHHDGSQVSSGNSLIFEIILPVFEEHLETVFADAVEPSWLGYELNERRKMGPRISKMKNFMSPLSLAESAVDLNLKLMKWRLLPDINLESIKDSKCLLLGAGTLGCCVARNLLGWGVRTITFVDNGTVSYSNPVRQNLYTHEDCVAEKPKAKAAADNLRKIFPGVTSSGYQFTIPMPGHPVGESLLDQTTKSVKQLTDLILQHDIVFLLMDSRESRWLPTLICASFGKIVINAAVGFDTYLVMRHGTRSERNEDIKVSNVPEGFKCINGIHLGCYFCNDITAPGDSLKDRTLDQQCTVTRPGIANIAGALAVELAISLLQHKEGASAPAFYTSSKTSADISRDNECVLGIIPHSIRGFLSLFSHVLPATERYDMCIACSDKVIEEYRANGFQFLLKVFDSSSYLEDLTGLSKIYNEANEIEIWDLSDEDSS